MIAARVAVLDVGATANLGWAAFDVEADPDLSGVWSTRRIERRPCGSDVAMSPERGTGLRDLEVCLGEALGEGLPVALGFEAPSFVPVRHQEQRLLSQRSGEQGSPFSAGAGAYALVAGLVESAFVLRLLSARGRVATLDPARWPTPPTTILLWEAFVSRDGKNGADSRSLPVGWRRDDDTEHVRDAATAADAFIRRGPLGLAGSDVDTQGQPAFNTLAAAALWAGLMTDTAELSRCSYVVKAT